MRTLLFCICLVAVGLLHAQAPANNADEYTEIYQQRIRKSQLNGVYIPSDLADAFVQLDRRIDPADRRRFGAVPEETAFRELFHSFGRWITLNWGFYGGSRYSNYLMQLGLRHPDDMAEFTIRMYHRHVTDRELDPKPVVEQIVKRRKDVWLERVLRGAEKRDTTEQNGNG